MKQTKRILMLGLLITGILSVATIGYARQAYAVRPATVTATDFYIPAGQDPWGTAFDGHGNLWLAVPGCDPTPTCSNTTPPGIIEEYNPSTSSWVATYQLPAKFAQPLFLAFDARGRLWFSMPMSNALGMYNPANQTFHKWTVPTANAGPWGVVVDHKGKVWFTEHYTNKVGRFDPGTHTFKEFTTPSANSQPYGITVDATNSIWFTENNSAVARIGEITPRGVLKEFTIESSPPVGLTPHLITVDPNGNIWWSEGFVGRIGELVVSEAKAGTNHGVTEYTYPVTCSTCNEHTSGISVDQNGLVWFDDSLQGVFGSFPDTGTGTFSLYNTPTLNGHPHDGLNVDSQNRVWFDEEFANKLAEVTQ